MPTIATKVDPTLRDQLLALAEASGTSLSAILRDLASDHVRSLDPAAAALSSEKAIIVLLVKTFYLTHSIAHQVDPDATDRALKNADKKLETMGVTKPANAAPLNPAVARDAGGATGL